MKLPFGLVFGKEAVVESIPDFDGAEVFQYAGKNFIDGSPSFSIKNLKSGDEVERVSKDKLELVRRREPLVSNAINIYTEAVKDSDIVVDCSDVRAKEICEEFLNDTEFKTNILTDVVGDMCTFGSSWHEIVWNEVGDRIVKLDTLDAKFMDFSRTRDEKVMYDETGNPSYYVQYIPSGMRLPDTIPTVNQGGNTGIRFDRDEILKVDLYTVGGSQHGIGIIEPVYNTILNKLDMQNGLAQSALRLGFPIIGTRVGNEKTYPSKQLMQTAANIFKNINESTGFAIPYFFEPMILEPKRSERVQQNLSYFTEQITAGLGIPRAILTGKGEQENKQTLIELKNNFVLTRIASIQEKIAGAVNKQVIEQLAKVNGWKEKPKMRFVRKERYNVEEVIDLVSTNILTTEEARRLLVR